MEKVTDKSVPYLFPP
uniref:Truncated PRDM1 isoform 2 n=1 Tax=Homo sapiens TaxID=9606 RepID=A1YZ20_HUMAN|nr:truncated PRDM1 isoform 2 [Homo sapiens]